MADKKIIDVVIPTLGKGLQEVRVVSFFKEVGDEVERDEVLFSVETDKSAVDVESIYTGKLVEWLAEEDDILHVRDPICRMEVDADVEEKKVARAPGQGATGSGRNRQKKQTRTGKIFVVPKARGLARKLGIDAETLQQIPAEGKRLKSADVQRYVDSGQPLAAPQPVAAEIPPAPEGAQDLDLPKQQQVLNFRFRQSMNTVIPSTIFSEIESGKLGLLGKDMLEAKGYDPAKLFVSDFAVFAYAVTQVLAKFPKFRSILLDDRKRREFERVNLGLAVQRGEDLATAVVGDADIHDFGQFVGAMQDSIDQVFSGADQAGGAVPFLITYMGNSGVLAGVPLLPAPATGILAFGSPQKRDGKQTAWLSLTFDHRLLNGLEAAQFLQRIDDELKGLRAGQYQQISPAPQPARIVASSTPATPPAQAASGPSQEALQTELVSVVAELLDLHPAEVALNESLGVLGMTSLMGLKLKTFLDEKLGEELPATLIWRYPTIASIVGYCASQYGVSKGSAAPTAAMPTSTAQTAPPAASDAGEINALLAAMEGLSEREIEELLRF